MNFKRKFFTVVISFILMMSVNVSALILSIGINEKNILFADVPKYHHAYDEILYFAEKGVFSGDQFNMFYPEKYITRAEVSAVIVKYMELETGGEKDFVYSDVSDGMWYSDFAYAANGYFPLEKNGETQLFEGHKLLTKAELCYIISQMAQMGEEDSYISLANYQDAEKVSPEIAKSISFVLAKGYINAENGSRIGVFAPVTKADIAKLLYTFEKKQIHVKVLDDGVEVIQNYGADKLKIQLKKSGPNSLVDFYSWTLLKEGEDALLKKPDLVSCTDCFSPYIVKAVNNIDGDLPHALDFTGGYHGYNNKSEGGSATARCESVSVKVNGENAESGFSGICKNVEIKTINLIQASNTKKFGGDGREVLKEIRTIYFDGDKWNFEIETMALEDVCIYKYFGPQFDTVKIADNITFVSGEEKEVFSRGQEFLKSKDKNCRKILLGGGKMDTEITVNSEVFDVANNMEYSAFYTNYGKTYFSLIYYGSEKYELSAGESFKLDGYYKFDKIKVHQ